MGKLKELFATAQQAFTALRAEVDRLEALDAKPAIKTAKASPTVNLQPTTQVKLDGPKNGQPAKVAKPGESIKPVAPAAIIDSDKAVKNPPQVKR